MDLLELQAPPSENEIELPKALRDILASHMSSSAELDRSCRAMTRELSQSGGLSRPRRFFFALRVEGEIVATIQLLWDDADGDPELANGQELAHLHNLWVHAERGRRGYARAIIEGLCGRASGLGITRLSLGVDSDNDAARQLYESLGFREFKRQEGREAGLQLILMARESSR